MGFPNFISVVQPLQYFYCLFAAIPLGCVKLILNALGTPTPQSPADRLRLADAVMRYEAMRAYLLETAERFRPAAGPEYAARVLRTKTYVAQESTKLADSFAGTALRPPLALALDLLVENFSLGDSKSPDR